MFDLSFCSGSSLCFCPHLVRAVPTRAQGRLNPSCKSKTIRGETTGIFVHSGWSISVCANGREHQGFLTLWSVLVFQDLLTIPKSKTANSALTLFCPWLQQPWMNVFVALAFDSKQLAHSWRNKGCCQVGSPVCSNVLPGQEDSQFFPCPGPSNVETRQGSGWTPKC